jgi:uncharacterized membrane-anchored protein YitT (DUF2179 family)
MNSIKRFWPTFRDFGLIALGAFIQAIAVRLFLVPANLASGGVTGIAQIIEKLLHPSIGIGLMVFLGNVPLFIIGWRYLGGPRFAIRTALAIVVYSFFTDFLIRFLPAHGLTDDIVLNALYGAVVSGIGYGLVYRGQGSSGGSDILVRILTHWRNIPMTQSYLITDAAVILAAGFVFGWKEALYALITLYVSGLVVDTTMEGAGTVRTALIITSEPQIVADKIMEELERGVTILAGTGAYTGAERPVLYCVVTRSEVPLLKTIVHEADAKAFMVVGAAHEALGEGFQPLKK